MSEFQFEVVPVPLSSAPSNVMATRTARDGTGKYAKNPDSADLTSKALDLRRRSWSFREIAAELGISVSSAHLAVQRGLREIIEEPAEDLRRLELEKLDALERAALEVLETEHVMVSNGRILPSVPDDGPKLAAVQALLKIGESRRKLLGLDSPARLAVDGGVRYEVVGVDPAQLK